MPLHHTKKAVRRAGLTLTELAITSIVVVIVMFVGLGVVVRDTRMSRSTIAIGIAEAQAQRMLRRLVNELSHARGEIPHALLTADLSPVETSRALVDDSRGFPPAGLLLVERGTGSVERIAYGGLGGGNASFLALGRGSACGTAAAHATGAQVLWAGSVQVVDLAGSPPPSAYDGRAREPEGIVHFLGDGTGFSYRVPTDPGGGSDVLDSGGIRWGASPDGVPTLSGWAALVYSPRSTLAESEIRLDVNRDGDETDVFDVGQIRALAWDVADPSVPPSDIGIGPSVILQERCRHGGDLDGDGLEDPIFLWDPGQRRLHVRLFVLGRATGEVPAVRRVDSMIFLRNEAGT